MRKLIENVSWALLASAAIVVGNASVANADQGKIVAKVPFDFIVGNLRLPAGDYVVNEIPDNPSVVSIVSAAGRQAAYALTIPLSADTMPVEPALRFKQFGNQHFLAEVIPAGGNEREIVLTPARMERALVSSARER